MTDLILPSSCVARSSGRLIRPTVGFFCNVPVDDLSCFAFTPALFFGHSFFLALGSAFNILLIGYQLVFLPQTEQLMGSRNIVLISDGACLGTTFGHVVQQIVTLHPFVILMI